MTNRTQKIATRTAALAVAFTTLALSATTITGRPGGTLEEARQAALETKKKSSGPITVVLPDGVYRFTKPVIFSAADSNVTYRAAHPGRVRFTGGVELPAAKPWKGDILVADLKAAGIGGLLPPAPNVTSGEGTQIVWNDEVLRYARWPNEGYAKIGKMDPKPTKDHFTYVDERIDGWAAEPNPYACGFFAYEWSSASIAIDRVDPSTRTIFQKGKPISRGYLSRGFWFGYNLLCELDVAGESYVDIEKGKAYFIPPARDRRSACEITVGDGFVQATETSGIVFEGVVFENCRDAAVTFGRCSGGGLRNCTFRNIGTRAVTLANSQEMFVDNCEIVRCGAGGIFVTGGDEMTLRHSGNVVCGCRISHYALNSLTYRAAIEVDGCGAVVRGNQIHDAPHVGILFWGREHLFESNEVCRVCLDSGEMGAFYTGRDWTAVGNVLRGNFVHDITSKRHEPNRAFMWDDGAAGLIVTGNVISNVQEGISLSAIGNVIESNVFVNVRMPVTGWQTWTRPEDYKPGRYTFPSLLDRFHGIPFRQEPWISRYPYLAKIDDAISSGKLRDPSTRTRIEGNVFIDCPERWIVGCDEKDQITPAGWDVRQPFRGSEM